MIDPYSSWPSYPPTPATPENELAPLAPLADGGEIMPRDAQGRFLTGNIGGGRRQGSRNRLTDTFIAAVEADFSEHGSDALARLRADDPAAYLRIVASLVPRDLILKRERDIDYTAMPLEEVMQMVDRARQNSTVEGWIEQAGRAR